ncbi:MAG: PEGA domain-containing protein [Patescibacteria group bacterium]
MEYPGTKLIRPYRRAIFIVFVVAFFIISPIIILYTAGYRYDWTNGFLKETGAISIDVEPKNALVFLNDARIKKRMPIRLKNYKPGKYHLVISASGYYDWVKDIEVKSRQTVYIKEVALLKKNEPIKIKSGNFDGLAISNDGVFIAFTQKNKSITEVWLLNNKTGDENILLRVPDIKQLKIMWAQKNNYLSISDAGSPYRQLFIFNADNPTSQWNLVQKIKSAVEKFQWKNSENPELFFSAGKQISVFYPATGQQTDIAKNIFLDWYFENGQMWAIRRDDKTKLYVITKDTLGFSSELISSDKIFEYNSGNEKNPPINLIAASEDCALLKKKDKPEMLLVSKDKKFTLSGEKFLISKYNDWWLMWTPWELWSFSVRDNEPALLSRSGEQLQEVMTLDKYNTLGLMWADKTTAIFPYYLVAHEFINNKIISSADDSESRIMYYTDESGLWKLNY